MAKTATPAANTTTAAAADQAAKSFVAFFTREGTKGPKVDLFKVMSDKPRAPMYSGKIGGKQVSLFLRKGSKGNFLGLVGDNNTDMGTANIGTLGNGTPVLVLDVLGADGKKTPVFASISKKVDNETLVMLGLNVAKQAEKAAAAKTKEAVPA